MISRRRAPLAYRVHNVHGDDDPIFIVDPADVEIIYEDDP